jgi:hypothetical protein
MVRMNVLEYHINLVTFKLHLAHPFISVTMHIGQLRFNRLQYYSGRRPLARMVRPIVKLGIRYGTGIVH